MENPETLATFGHKQSKTKYRTPKRQNSQKGAWTHVIAKDNQFMSFIAHSMLHSSYSIKWPTLRSFLSEINMSQGESSINSRDVRNGSTQELDCFNVISLKQRSKCRHVTYFDTNAYVILCHKQNKKDWGTKNERVSLFSLTTYMRGIYILVRGDVSSLYYIQMSRASWMLKIM